MDDVNITIFISYSHKDEEVLKELLKFLKPFLRGLGMEIRPWSDKEIPAGSNWRADIRTALACAKVAVLLVSQDFLDSKFIYEDELPAILDAVKEGRMALFWIPVRSSTYKQTGLEGYQSLGRPDRPLDKFERAEREQHLVDICGELTKELKRICAADGPPAPPGPPPGGNETAGRRAREGMEALVGLMKNPAVQRHVSAYKVVFDLANRQIEILRYYKALHDLLHTFQLSCYDKLTSIARKLARNPEDPALWDEGFDYDSPLTETVVSLKQISEQQNSLGGDAFPWVTTMGGNLKTLSTAIDKRNGSEVKTAIQPIRRVMSLEPIILNDRLVEAARRLPLSVLADALSGISAGLAPEQGRDQVKPATLKQLQEGVTDLRDLDVRLTRLVDKHRMWQELDREIRGVEGSVNQDVAEVVSSWPALREMTEALCADLDEDLANLLVKTMRRLDQGIEAKDEEGRIRQFFLSYRNVAIKCFFKVDVDLKALCDKLQRVGEPLAKVWEMIQ